MLAMSERPIGLLDSGIGGLTVLKEARKLLPNESFIYIGDNARNPYGPRSAEEIRRYTLELVQFLMNRQVKMVVIACNTATAVVLDELKGSLPIPVLGVILSGSMEAVRHTKTKEVGLLATQSTVDSSYYNQKMSEMDKSVRVTSLACPEFVDLVETNQYKSEEAEAIVQAKLSPLKEKNVDALILGCTHFPLLSPFIKKEMGQKVRLIDSGALTAEQIGQVLEENQMAAAKNSPVKTEIYTTGDAQLFRAIAGEWMEDDELEVNKINVEGLKLDAE
ncbi:MAG: glutamate racemase [Alkalibacterium sp.]|nr:glutamate racemase [Alkalibacterium sp.]